VIRVSGGTVRGLVAAAACTLLAYLGHAGAGGTRPGPAVLLTLAVPLCLLLARRHRDRVGPWRILAVVGGSQLGLHLLLQLLGPAPAVPASEAMPDMAAVPDIPGMAAMPDIPGVAALPGTAGLSGMPGIAHPGLMTGAHLLATVVTAAVLAGAERSAQVLATALLGRAGALLPVPVDRPVPPAAVPRPAARAEPSEPRLRRVPARRLYRRRGPPLPA
jgi:hypothetical protein